MFDGTSESSEDDGEEGFTSGGVVREEAALDFSFTKCVDVSGKGLTFDVEAQTSETLCDEDDDGY